MMKSIDSFTVYYIIYHCVVYCFMFSYVLSISHNKRIIGTGVGLDRIFIFVVSDPSILPIWPLLIAL